MSRSTATTKSAITFPYPFHLIAQHGDSGTALALILSLEAYPNNNRSIEMTSKELNTFRWFMQYALYIAKGGSGLWFRTQPDKLVGMPHDALMTIFYFLHADIAQCLTRQCTVPAQSLSSLPDEHNELKNLILSLRLAPPKITKYDLPFFDYKLGHLSNASLNADLEIVQLIITKTSPERLRILLSTKTTAIITHLGIERTGTPLQMALYSGDEDVVAHLKKVMDSAEFERQSKEVFRNALPPNTQAELDAKNASVLEYYNEMLVVQHAEAEILCKVFQYDILNNQSVMTNEAFADFRKKFICYVKNNPTHNPYILDLLYVVHGTLPCLYDEHQDGLFLQKIIGLVHALSSARWLQHYAQGICCLGSDKGTMPESARRSFVCRDSNPPIDVRSYILDFSGINSSIISDSFFLGINLCMSIFGYANDYDRGNRLECASYGNFRLTKTVNLKELIQPGQQLSRSAGVWGNHDTTSAQHPSMVNSSRYIRAQQPRYSPISCDNIHQAIENGLRLIQSNFALYQHLTNLCINPSFDPTPTWWNNVKNDPRLDVAWLKWFLDCINQVLINYSFCPYQVVQQPAPQLTRPGW